MSSSIHVIFKTHLDVGFTDYASAVLNNYFKSYIPAALRVAREMRESGRPERFIWTTGSFLIYEYLERANAAERKLMEEGILHGDIAWHALPFTTHTELMDADLFRFGLTLSQEMDRRFGKTTIAAKMTDVPGHTRGIIPLLAEAGVEFLHIGVNPGSSVPEVPPLFRWQSPQGKEIVVMYESGYGSAFVIDGIEDSLAFGHTGDNLGPQSAQQVLDVYHDIQKTFPEAKLFASTLDHFAEKLRPIRAQLPLLRQEIGDTWIHGVGTDPIKVARFKELSRLRQRWLAAAPSLAGDERFKSFSRRLLMVPEHTWGMDEKTYLADSEHYNKEAFNAVRGQPHFQKFQASWAEKRAYPYEAVMALEDLPQAAEAHAALERLRPSLANLADWQPFDLGQAEISVGGWQVRFDAVSGALVGLDGHGGQWAAAGHPLAWLRYQTFSDEDYERFFHQYILPSQQDNGWSREDFTKPGLAATPALSRFWQPTLNEAFRQDSEAGQKFLFHLRGEPASVSDYGCPQDFWLQYTFSQNEAIQIELQWFHKPASRLPEALWLSFVPCLPQEGQWLIEKLGQEVSPFEVVPNGNRHLHASGKYVRWAGKDSAIEIRSLDAPLVAPGKPSLLDFNNDPPDLSLGMHFNLLNNLWGTNFPMWFEEDCRFRFELKLP